MTKVIDAPSMADLAVLNFLKVACGYDNVTPLPGRRWACTERFLFTTAILVGRLGTPYSYDDRWCYSTAQEAARALEEWDGHGEPTGWHRHPPSGRRRPEGDPGREYVAL